MGPSLESVTLYSEGKMSNKSNYRLDDSENMILDKGGPVSLNQIQELDTESLELAVLEYGERLRSVADSNNGASPIAIAFINAMGIPYESRPIVSNELTAKQVKRVKGTFKRWNGPSSMTPSQRGIFDEFGISYRVEGKKQPHLVLSYEGKTQKLSNCLDGQRMLRTIERLIK